MAPGHPLGRRSMIDFVVVSSDLRPYVLDTHSGKERAAELSTDHHLVVSWLRWQRRKLDRPGRPKRIVRVCWERLAEPSVREVFNSHLRKSFSQIPREAGDIESEWTMFSASIVDAGSSKLWTQGLWCLSWWQSRTRWWTPEVRDAVRLKKESYRTMLACGTPDAVDRYQCRLQASRSLPGRSCPEAKTSGLGGCGWGAVDLSTEDIVGRWKKYFEDLLNPTDLPSNEEAEDGDSEVDSSITQAEVTEVVRKLLGGKAPGVDEIRPEYLKSLDVVGLSWLTRLCNIAYGGWGQYLWSGKLGWWSLFLKRGRGTGECVPTTEGSHFSASPGRSTPGYWRGELAADSPTLGFRRNNAVFVLVVEQWTSSLYPPPCRVLEGLWEFAQPVHMCFVDLEKAFDRVPRGILWGVLQRVWGPGAFAKGCSVSVRPEQELGSALPAMMLSCWLHSSQDLQHVLERFAAECEAAAGMRISTSKSEAMVLDRKRVVCPLRVVSGEVLPQVEEFKYLGVLFTKVRERWSVRLTGGLVQRPQIMARLGVPDRRGEEGAESKGVKCSRFTRVNLRFPPSPMVMNFGDRVSEASVIREELGVEPLLLRIERSQLRWLGHLFRMPSGRLPREVFQACPTGRRPREDPGHAGETMSLSTGLGTPRGPPEELEEVSGINLLGRFPGGTQSLTAETLLSLSSRESERESERQGQRENDWEGEEGDVTSSSLCPTTAAVAVCYAASALFAIVPGESWTCVYMKKSESRLRK
ncbi:hypothetical protein L3Q82_002501 [Scortum barcoo]|uniref:Uncharacterized protein n=1 Tax=Scortum barcoo TaxID=214431 RepID=A0ACB8VYU9_9TELE|nr:hypothetical protein L3Q82_002501 [Scortum barcoo]